MTHEWQIRPRWESCRYRPSPARREAIYGRIVPMDDAPPHPLVRLFLVGAAIVSTLLVIWR